MRKQILLSVVLVAVSAGTAMAGHGKAGLWNVSTTMSMPMASMPPEAMEKMKAMGMSMPSGQTFNTQICMTQAEVDADKPPAMTQNDMGCSGKVTGMTANGVTEDMTCNGRMKGTGHMQISFTGDSHYEGSYNFNGNMEGHPMQSSSSFKGDWVKADCGSVKPFAAK